MQQEISEKMNRKHVNGVWCTRDDVLQDLALATGCGLDVDEHCFVYGERAPPRPECDIDDEMKILFGGRQGDSEGDQKFVEPDLKGIMSMIRMVETEEGNISPKEKPTDIIVISKLNPNVREFVPKSQASQTDTPKTDETTPSPSADKKTRKETPKCTTPKSMTLKSMTSESLTSKSMTPQNTTSSPMAGTSNSIESKTPIHTPSLTTEAEINSLKDKILSKTSKDPYEHRREKNAAIATLLRYFTTPPITKDVKEKPIKLYPPEFFERCKASEFKGADDTSTEVDENTEKPITTLPLPTEEPIKDIIINENNIMTKETKEDDDIEHTNLTPEVDKNLNIDEPTSSHELAEQQKSIAKVNEWLNGPKPQKRIVQKPVIHTGPIAYKRKEVMSPSSTTSAIIDKKISKHDVKAYKPSTYATELRIKYENNKKEANKPLNLWDNLEEQLKKKDEEIKKKSEQQDS